MANEEQLAILRQGVEVWNKWRFENLKVDIDLRRADLRDQNLQKVNFNAANLASVDLTHSNLEGALLIKANLTRAKLVGTNLRKAELWGVIIAYAHLKEVNLSETNLGGVELSEIVPSDDDQRKNDLRNAVLRKTNLSYAKLNNFNLDGADLREAKLDGAEINYTTLIGADLRKASLIKTMLKFTDLREAQLNEAIMDATDLGLTFLQEATGLDKVVHQGPSLVGVDTIYHSKGHLPEIFLRGCGFSDWEIAYAQLYNPELSNEEINSILYRTYDQRATRALQISPLFISYSQSDSVFVDKLESQLNQKGIRFWRDIHDMKAGRIEKQIDRAIRQNRTVLLILSKNSISSDWVEHEVRTARGLEKEVGHDVLCPIALDDSWKSSPWPKRVMEQIMEYNILDFSVWEDDVKFEGMFRKLIDGLELFYKR